MRYCISVDWFQVFCESSGGLSLIPDTYFQGTDYCPSGYIPMYHVTGGIERHPIFRFSFTIRLHGFALAHIFMVPKMSAIKPTAVAVKVANRALYTDTWAWYLKDIMRALDLRFVSISRLDICCDLQTFADGLDPRLFIQRYLSEGNPEEITQYIRKGSNMYHVTGRKRKTFVDSSGVVSAERTQNRPEYIRWGSHKSGVSVYLYNKSLELLEKHHKPYIQEMWQKNGIIEDETKPVWRVEISIKSKGMTVENKKAAASVRALGLRDMRQLNIESFNNAFEVENVWWAYANKFFAFKKVTSAKYVKDMPEVLLFDVEFTPTIMPRDISKSYDTGRSEKLAAKCLERIIQQYPAIDHPQKVVLYKAASVLTQIGIMKQKVFEELIPEELSLLSPYGDAWNDLLRNYRVRPSQLQRMRLKCEHVMTERLRELMEEPLWNIMKDKTQF